jgi:hypothetical protein
LPFPYHSSYDYFMPKFRKEDLYKILYAISPTPTVAAGSWNGCIQNVVRVDSAGVQHVTQVPTAKCFEVIFGNIVGVLVGLAMVGLFAMLTYGGFKYLTSGSDAYKNAEAKKTMTYAILGVALMAISYLLLRIIEAFTGVNVTLFKINSD